MTASKEKGHLHPLTIITRQLVGIFAEMGFSVAEGPRIDTDWYNFDALNIPGHHPARAEMDTFYTHRADGDDRPPHVLRTHTSPVQIQSMEKMGAPLRVICPGGVYRADYDQTHTPMFHQVEGLALDKDISILKDRRGGTTKPLTLEALRERMVCGGQLTFDEGMDWGGCGCAVE